MNEFDWYTWLLIPALIFLARVCDVSLSTIRIMFVMAGRKRTAAILGAFEVLIWLAAIGQIMQNLSNFACYIGYAGGFATGTYIGMKIEERLAYGHYVIRIITDRSEEMVAFLRSHKFQVTVLKGEGNKGDTNLIFLMIKRANVDFVLNIVREYAPQAIYTVGSIKFAKDDSMTNPTNIGDRRHSLQKMVQGFKKSK